ncbi:MAG: SIR2 family protein [Bacteroidia bacterium]|nr:SIR2 family protein [Bacteroidia bacterium]
MQLSEFIRLYPLRAKSLAWFFGAGTSASAGIPTASELVWEFKRKIYCSEEGYQISLFNNLSNPAIRNQIQSYFNSKNEYPKENSIKEYSIYFEKAYPSARDRSDYLMQQLQGMQNSFGHKVIGVLMKNEFIKLVFTTNFDKAFENAAIDQLKTMDKFFVASIDNTLTAIQKYHSNLRPFITKIHGDYFSEKLKNTSEELKQQDFQLRDILFHSCISNGLAVMGYSGRDESVMEIFNKALDQSTSFPNGIFWFIRTGSNPLKEVVEFIDKAKSKKIQAEFVEIETFDSAWAEIVKGISDLPVEDISKLNTNYFKRTNIKLPDKGTKYPVIRFNGIEIEELPSTARLIKCDAGNTKEIKELIHKSKADLIAIRKQSGIVGFGSDDEFEKVFSTYGQTEKDIFQIPESTINYDDSTLKGLLTYGLLKALTNNKPLIDIKRRNRYLVIPDPKMINDPFFEPLKKVLETPLTGIIPKTSIKWIHAIEICLQKKFSTSFLVISPTTLASKTDNQLERLKIAPFIKECTAKWFNNKYSNILDVWLDLIFLDKKEINISAFGNELKGFNANYKLKRESAFSRTI